MVTTYGTFFSFKYKLRVYYTILYVDLISKFILCKWTFTKRSESASSHIIAKWPLGAPYYSFFITDNLICASSRSLNSQKVDYCTLIKHATLF